MRLAYSSATPEVKSMPLAWVGPLDTVLPEIAEIGYEGVEFQTQNPAEIDVRELRRQVDAAGLTVTAFSTGMLPRAEGLVLVHADPDVRSKCIERFKRVIELAAEFGVDPALGSARGRLASAPSEAQGWAWFRESVEQLVRHAEKLGNRVVLEPQCRLNTDFLMTIAQTCEFIESLGAPPSLVFEADTYHQSLEERSIVAAWVRGRKYMSYVQLGDSNRLAPGQGFLPWRDMIETLRALEYDGWLSMEFSQKPDSPTAARQAYAFTKPLISW
jgi:D-psicose/D-tagatose/L-ribulose 3-epimerase